MREDHFNPLQGTVAQVIKFAGVGLHSGKTLSLEIHPLGPNQGIHFLRTDLSNAPKIHAHPDNIISTLLCTTLGLRGISIATVEHVLSNDCLADIGTKVLPAQSLCNRLNLL